jgi:hypothetical protein
MPLVVLRISTLRKILIIATAVLPCAWFQTPTALAQHVRHVGAGVAGGGHFRTGGHIAAPHVIAPRGVGAPPSRAMFLRPPGGFPQRPFPIFRRPFFNRVPFLWSWQAFNSSWWLYCGPIWGWNSGCGDFFFYPNTTEHYLAPPLTYASPVYVYSQDRQPLVQLFMNDGTVYNVNDYWFVNDQIHFTMLDESGTKSVEQVIASDDLDVKRTIDVNSRRGFRVVMRNEPLEQYLRDHPDLTPPLLQPPQKD